VSRRLKHYNLSVILAVGSRVRSRRGTQFRQWATAQLEQYLVKGFAMDDEAGGRRLVLRRVARPHPRYPLLGTGVLAEVLDIYATSIDYDPGAESFQKFFAIVSRTRCTGRRMGKLPRR
jgi:hypothetical protein